MAACGIKMEEVQGNVGSSDSFSLQMGSYLMHFPLDCFVFSGVSSENCIPVSSHESQLMSWRGF